MDEESDIEHRILQSLRFKPRGMTITEIAKKTGITRNSISKHLHFMQVTGQVDVQAVGNAKMYSIAQRVPLSAFLVFTRNMILVLDSRLNIVQCNNQFLTFANARKEDLVGENIQERTLPVVSSPEALDVIEGLEREQVITEITWQERNEAAYFEMEVIPTVFNNGEQGCTIVLENITEKKKYIQSMEFLARTAMELVDLPATAKICEIFAERFIELVPGALVYVLSYDGVRREFIMRAVADENFRDGVKRILGRDPVGMSCPHTENVEPPSSADIERMVTQGLQQFTFSTIPGENTGTFFDIFFRQIPHAIREVIRSAYIIHTGYGMPFVWRDRFLGGMGFFLRADQTLDNSEAVESFVREASIAISRKMTEQKLIRSERIFRDVVDYSPFPAALNNQDGRYTFINRAFTRVFGYTLDNIPTDRDWFRLAFPDSEYRSRAIATWKADLAESSGGAVRPRTFTVRCKNGTMKDILFRPVILCDKTQYTTYEDVTEIRLAHRAILSDIEKLQKN